MSFTPFTDGEYPVHTALNRRFMEVAASINAVLNGLVGAVLPYGGSSIPSGWLVCDGAQVSRATYAALFGIIGTTWGAGDGSTTFNLPDLRGRTAIGAVTGAWLTARTLGQSLGEEAHQLTTAELPAHTHNYDFVPSGSASGGGAGTAALAGAFSANTNSEGGDVAHNNMQPSAVVNWIIKT